MGKFTSFLTFTVALFAVAMYFSPFVMMHMIVMVDFFTPFSTFKSEWVKNYHASLVANMPERPAASLREVPYDKLTTELLHEYSNGYTTPVVIRNALAGSEVLEKWNNRSWWIENYGDEEVICKYVETGTDEKKCTVAEALSVDDPSKRLYVSGEARMFLRRPELAEMVQTDALTNAAPGIPAFTQLFLGYKGMGSDMHAAMGTNIFRQIVGKKKWWLVPMSEMAYVYPSLNPNGFSAHTLTTIGKGDEDPSPWLSKLNRWEVVLNPGDVMLNPPWMWHGILNVEGGEGELSVGVPTRYSVKRMAPAIKNNPLFTLIGAVCIFYNYGEKFFTSATAAQDGIERARNARAAELSKEMEEMERAM